MYEGLRAAGGQSASAQRLARAQSGLQCWAELGGDRRWGWAVQGLEPEGWEPGGTGPPEGCRGPLEGARRGREEAFPGDWVGHGRRWLGRGARTSPEPFGRKAQQTPQLRPPHGPEPRHLGP